MRYKFPGLKRILADGGYRGDAVREMAGKLLLSHGSRTSGD